jgi:hypothetical protein
MKATLQVGSYKRELLGEGEGSKPVEPSHKVRLSQDICG